jgi:hypothetical protein
MLLSLLLPLALALPHSADLDGGHSIEWAIVTGDDAAEFGGASVHEELGDHLLLSLRLNFTTGWFGFGIGEPASGAMPGADILTIEVNGGVDAGDDAVTITDRWASDFAYPEPDDCPDWHLVEVVQGEGTTSVTVRRSLDTGDTQDRAIRLGERERILYAWGDSPVVGYHGTSSRVLTTLDFAGTIEDRLLAIQSNPNITVIDLLNNYTMTADETVYAWAGHALYPDLLEEGVDYHIVAVEHLVQEDMKAHVHHFVSHLSNTAITQSMVFHVWAGGVPALVVPDACGYPVSQSTLNNILVQTHYDNAINENVGAIDRSGIRVYLTSELRDNHCGVMQLGDPKIKLGGQTFDEGTIRTDFACPGSCVKKDFTIFASFLHMHSFGTRMWTDHRRAGESLGLLDEVDFWDENLQSFKEMSLEVKEGDELLTTCIHKSDGALKWGEASSEEMCIHFLSYYPFDPSLGFCGVQSCGARTNTTILAVDRPVFGSTNPDHPCDTPVTSLPFPWDETDGSKGEGEGEGGDDDDGASVDDDDDAGNGAVVDDNGVGTLVASNALVVMYVGHALAY